MSRHPPNVILLTVDALRADRTSVLGYGRPTTPTLERMAENALVCEQAASPAAFTHICFPSLLTSSRPLSHGGYDNGPAGRPATLFDVFHGAGYETTAFCTTHWVSRFQGYRNIDHEHLLFTLNTLPGLALALYRSTLAAWHRGEVDDAVAVSEAQTIIGKMFEAIELYAQERLDRHASDARDFPSARLVRDGYDFSRVVKLVRQHRAEFECDVLAYLHQHLHYVPKAHQWIGHEWRTFRRPATLLRLAFQAVFIRIMLKAALPSTAALRGHRFKTYVDGADVTTKIIRQIEQWDGQKPFFIWNHYQDTHVPYCAGYGTSWYRQTPDYLRQLGYEGVDVATAVGGKPRTPTAWQAWSALYDAAIRFTDEQIGRVVAALERRGIAGDTIVAVCGDHGEELGEHGDISHHFKLYSHNVRIPMIFYRKGMSGQRVTGLTDLLDLAPTLTSMAAIDKAAGWVGASVDHPDVKRRDHLVLETFHGGNCLFETRPLYMAVRDRQLNFIWKEFRDPEDKLSAEGQELYDVAKDPAEQTNLYRLDHPEVPRFEAALINRLREIPEITEDRIARAFPHHITARRIAAQ